MVSKAALSPEQAIGFICRNDFSKAQYMDVRMTTLQQGIDLYPSYNTIIEAKKLCTAGMVIYVSIWLTE